MKKKDTLDQEISVAVKCVRTAIRLKHSLAADEEINETLPDLEKQIVDAAMKGEPFMLDLTTVFSG